jgi:hypothetical protein
VTPKKRLGEMLMDAGIIDETQLKAALGHQRQWGVRLGQALVDLKLATEPDIVRALSTKFGFPIAKLGELEPYGLEQAVGLVPRDFAIRNNVFPMAADTASLTVAMSDPTNLAIVDELRFRTGRRVKVCMGGDREVADAVRRHYPAGEAEVEAIALDLDVDEGQQSEAVFDPFGGGSKDALEAFFGQPSEPAPAPAAAPPPAAVAPPAAPAAVAAAAPAPARPRAPAPPAPAPAPKAVAAPAAKAPVPRPPAPSPAPARAPAPAPSRGPAPAPAPAAARPAAPSPRPAPAPAPAAARPAPAAPPAAAPSPAAPRPVSRSVELELEEVAPPAAPSEPGAGEATFTLEAAPPDLAPFPDEITGSEPILATDLAPEEEMVEGRAAPRPLTPDELAILDALERLAGGHHAEPDIVKPAQAMAALVRLLLRKRVITEQEFLDEFGKK